MSSGSPEHPGRPELGSWGENSGRDVAVGNEARKPHCWVKQKVSFPSISKVVFKYHRVTPLVPPYLK